MNVSPQHFLVTVIRPTLLFLELHSPAAEQLLLSTALQESHLKHRRQLSGPALSYFQIEPATHDDIWENFLAYRQALAKKVTTLMTHPDAGKIEQLESNDHYAAAMARVHYLRVPESLPAFNNMVAMSAYWKRYYNTALGRGRESEFIANWQAFGVSDPVYQRIWSETLV